MISLQEQIKYYEQHLKSVRKPGQIMDTLDAILATLRSLQEAEEALPGEPVAYCVDTRDGGVYEAPKGCGDYVHKSDYDKLRAHALAVRAAALRTSGNSKLCYNRATKKIEKLVHGICVEQFDAPEEV